MTSELTQQNMTQAIATVHPLILASASPRRSEILSNLGFEFEVVPADIDEDSLTKRDLAKLAMTLAEQKAASVAMSHPNNCVVAADTVVDFDGSSLGKPGTTSEAISMLAKLGGKSHKVHTGVAVNANGLTDSAVATTKVTMRSLSSEEIEEYVKSGAQMDKAGAYGIQDAAFSPVESYDGSYLNVVGMPVEELAGLLLNLGEIDAEAASRIRESDR